MTVENAQTKDIMDVFPLVFSELIKSTEHQREIEEVLVTTYNFQRGIFAEILVNNEKLEQFNKEEIIILADILHKTTKNEKINPKEFYSKTDVVKALKYRFEVEEEITLPYTIEGVLRSGEQDFITVMSYKEIAALWNSNVLTYNFQSQRLSKKKMNTKGKITEKADVNLKSVKNIARLMLEKKYRPSTILFNMLVDGQENFEYEDGELTIGEGTTLNLIDGMHRVQAILTVIEQEPNFEGYMNVDIKNYPLPETQQLLAITNMVNRFDKTLIKNYMAESIGAQITKDIMNIPELKNRISIKTSLDRKLNYFTNFAILSEAIESIFAPENNKDRYDYTEVLKKFFGYLVPTFENELIKNKNQTSKVSWITHHNVFVGFVVVCKKIFDKYGKDFPVDEIVRVINSIDLSRKEGSEFNDLMTTQGKVNSNQVKAKIRKFFEEKSDELLS